MSKPTMATLRAAAKKYGATVDDDQIDFGHINVDAPTGKVWSGEDAHALCLHWCTLDVPSGRRRELIALSSASITSGDG